MKSVLLPISPETGAAVSDVGGKGASLCRLVGMKVARVPHGAIIPRQVVSRLFQGQGARALRQLAAAWGAGDDDEELRHRFLQLPIPVELMRALAGFFRHRDVLIVRSSAVMEDSASRSFAGHFTTQMCRRDDVATTIQHCTWESVRSGFLHATDVHAPAEQRLAAAASSLALVVQVAVNAEKSGVAFSRSPWHPRAMMVTAAYGTCHGVVDGAVPTDTYVVHAHHSSAELTYKTEMTTLAPRLEHLLPGQPVETPLGESTFHLPYDNLLALAGVPKALAGQSTLSDDEIVEIGAALARIRERYGHEVDVEWCMDEGDLTLLQARPITARSTTTGRRAREAHGRVASPGVASGPVCVLREVSEVSRASAGDILVVSATDPEWLPALYKAAGIISEEGSPLSHTAIVAREIGIPCLVGVEKATRGRFLNGETVTVDANRGLVLRGSRARGRSAVSSPSPTHRALCLRASHLHELEDRPTRITVSALLDDVMSRELAGPLRVEHVLQHLRQLERRVKTRLHVEWDLAPESVPPDPLLAALRHALGARG
ncbi:MAG: PEP/pyruvate-binding domain-containing protein [Myxococcota bacterium]